MQHELEQSIDGATSLPPLQAWVQPIVALTTGTVAGHEALARFAGSRTSTALELERAWSRGVGPALEATAIHAALALPDRPRDAYLAVNVSPRAMSSSSVREALDRDLGGVIVEITESQYVSNPVMTEIASWLRDRDARLAIDDVGTGYAGLERLLVLQPDLLKLDRSLTVALATDPVTRRMVESLVHFAARSGAGVCAEGIEDTATLQMVAELDIAYGQGYFLGAPAPTWATLSEGVVRAAAEVHREALSGTPKQSVKMDDLVLLERMADRLSEAEDLEDVHHAVAAAGRLVAADDVVIELLHADGGRIERLSHHTWLTGQARPLDRAPLLRWVLDSRRAAQVLVTDPRADQAVVASLRAAGSAALLLVPVITRGTSLGVLALHRRSPEPWTLTQIRLARIAASHLAATLDRLLPGR